MNFSLNKSFVSILLIQYITHYRVSKVIRIKQRVHLPMKLCNQEGIWKTQLYTDSLSPKIKLICCMFSR